MIWVFQASLGALCIRVTLVFVLCCVVCWVDSKITEEGKKSKPPLLCPSCRNDITMFIGKPSCTHIKVCQCYRSGNGSAQAERQLTRSIRATVGSRSDFVIQLLLFRPTNFTQSSTSSVTTVALMRFLGMGGGEKIGPLPGVTETSDTPNYRSITIYTSDPLPFMTLGADPWASHIYGHGYGDYHTLSCNEHPWERLVKDYKNHVVGTTERFPRFAKALESFQPIIQDTVMIALKPYLPTPLIQWIVVRSYLCPITSYLDVWQGQSGIQTAIIPKNLYDDDTDTIVKYCGVSPTY
jgi:hypothetical protein